MKVETNIPIRSSASELMKSAFAALIEYADVKFDKIQTERQSP
jgi:hypothetical protein